MAAAMSQNRLVNDLGRDNLRAFGLGGSFEPFDDDDDCCRLPALPVESSVSVVTGELQSSLTTLTCGGRSGGGDDGGFGARICKLFNDLYRMLNNGDVEERFERLEGLQSWTSIIFGQTMAAATSAAVGERAYRIIRLDDLPFC